MNIEHYLQKYGNNPERLKDLRDLYNNWFETGCVLYNAMSEIVVTCHDDSSDVFEKISSIKERALNAIDQSNDIGLTNPDLYEWDRRTGTLAKQIKLSKARRANV